MAHPVIHAEIRSATPTQPARSSASCSAGRTPTARFPATRSSTRGSRARFPTAIGPLQGGERFGAVLRRVDDVEATLERAEELGGTTIQPAQSVPGVSFGVFADAQGHVVGVAAN